MLHTILDAWLAGLVSTADHSPIERVIRMELNAERAAKDTPEHAESRCTRHWSRELRLMELNDRARFNAEQRPRDQWGNRIITDTEATVMDAWTEYIVTLEREE